MKTYGKIIIAVILIFAFLSGCTHSRKPEDEIFTATVGYGQNEVRTSSMELLEKFKLDRPDMKKIEKGDDVGYLIGSGIKEKITTYWGFGPHYKATSATVIDTADNVFIGRIKDDYLSTASKMTTPLKGISFSGTVGLIGTDLYTQSKTNFHYQDVAELTFTNQEPMNDQGVAISWMLTFTANVKLVEVVYEKSASIFGLYKKVGTYKQYVYLYPDTEFYVIKTYVAAFSPAPILFKDMNGETQNIIYIKKQDPAPKDHIPTEILLTDTTYNLTVFNDTINTK